MKSDHAIVDMNLTINKPALYEKKRSHIGNIVRLILISWAQIFWSLFCCYTTLHILDLITMHTSRKPKTLYEVASPNGYIVGLS